MEFLAVVEIKLRGDLLDAGIHQNVLSVKDYDRVDDVLKISYLMCADDYYSILACVLHHSRTEGGLRRDVQSVCGFVHVKMLHVAGKCECDVGLLQLSCRHPVHFLGRVVLEFGHDLQELSVVVSWPEFSVHPCPFLRLFILRCRFICQEVLVTENVRSA